MMTTTEAALADRLGQQNSGCLLLVSQVCASLTPCTTYLAGAAGLCGYMLVDTSEGKGLLLLLRACMQCSRTRCCGTSSGSWNSPPLCGARSCSSQTYTEIHVV